jgi:hypothetical protein
VHSHSRHSQYWHSRFRRWHARHFDLAFAGGGGDGPDRAQRWGEAETRRAQRFSHRRFEEDEFISSAGLGVRRPLRFLAFKLDLDDAQTAQLARILERLKLERAQAALDLRRAAADLADALEATEFTRAKVDSANELRAAAARRVEAAVATALQELHVLLEPDQRARLAEFVRTGVIRI